MPLSPIVPCGWLKDRFGVSWQVVPEGPLPLLTGPDAAARGRTFAALLEIAPRVLRTSNPPRRCLANGWGRAMRCCWRQG